ncbi:MAG TPA: hypothetical protein VKC51_06935 [Lacunisphaera sp.]|nr:hypothetical protein [Lacunisphaera sp.]
MKILLLAVIPLLGFSAEKNPSADSVPAAQAAEESAFGLVAAQKLADARRCELHGVCGMCLFKERIGDAWVFRTKVGYAGLPAPDITVFPPAKAHPPKEKKADPAATAQRP